MTRIKIDIGELTGELISELADTAHLGLDAFVAAGGTDSGDNTDEKLVDFISALRHLVDRYGFRWDQILRKADRLYESEKGESEKGGIQGGGPVERKKGD
jgi:hypothetical protein